MLYQILFFVLAALGLIFNPGLALAQGPFTGPTAGKLAVTPAGYDNMGEVLQKLGFQAETIQEGDLASLSNLQKYDVVYINCSGSIDGQTNAASALRDFVRNGGIVYASDYANSLISAAFPGKINFYKGSSPIPGIEEGSVLSSRVGAPGKVQAKVTDPGLAGVLGKSAVEVNYDLGGWVVIDSVGGGARVHMRGPAPIIDYSSMMSQTGEALEGLEGIDFSDPAKIEEWSKKFMKTSQTLENKPYVVSFAEGKGEVLYTTFHNEAQTTSDVKSVLNWFAVRGKAGKLARAVQELVTGGENKVLQETVDSINQGETKQYLFNATGTDSFSISLNFGGSALKLTVTDPRGKKIVKQTVETPPFTQEIQAKGGKYTMTVEGADVPEQNMPFVLTVAGPESAAATPIIEEEGAKKAGGLQGLGGIPLTTILFVVVGLVVLVLIIVGVVALSRRGKTANKQPPTSSSPPKPKS